MTFSKNPNLKTTHCLPRCTLMLKWEPSDNVYVQWKLMISFSQRVFPRVKNKIRWLGHPEKNSQLAVSNELKFKQGVLQWGVGEDIPCLSPVRISQSTLSEGCGLHTALWLQYCAVWVKRDTYDSCVLLTYDLWGGQSLMTVLWWSWRHHQDISWPWMLYPLLVMHPFFHVLFPN